MMSRLNIEKILLFLSMSELLASISTLIFSFDLLRLNPSTSNLPALSGYVLSIFGTFASVFSLLGVIKSRKTLLIIAKMINWVILACTTPTIAFHVQILAALAEMKSEILFGFDQTKAQHGIWIIAAQIIILSFSMIILFFTNSISSALQQDIEKENTIKRQIRKFQEEMWKKSEKPTDESYFRIFV